MWQTERDRTRQRENRRLPARIRGTISRTTDAGAASMILIGQYDSPFVRRVGVALMLHGMPFEHRPWSVFGDRERIAAYNPLLRVPTLVLDDGEVLIESTVILDHLDEQAGTERLIPDSGPARRTVLKQAALATGLADKAVSLFYERALHRTVSDVWVERCEAQMQGVLDVLDAAWASRPGPFWLGAGISHADIALACAARFTREAHPGFSIAGRWPAVTALATRCEAMPPFQIISQAFNPPS
jgi:glutathione S-transferase